MLLRKPGLAAAFLLIAASLSAQKLDRITDPSPDARLSYDISAFVQPSDARHICIAVSREGEYRIERSLMTGTQRQHGKLTEEQFAELKKLLGSGEFRAISGNPWPGVIREDSETFEAEIPTKWQDEHSSQRLQWLNADGENPFPASMANVVDWMKHFQPKGGESFEYTEYPDVCPRGGLRLLTPPLAKNQRP